MVPLTTSEIDTGKEVGTWGTYDLKAIESASSEGRDIEDLIANIPTFQAINGQNVVLAQKRGKRPNGDGNKSNGQRLVFQSIHYGCPDNGSLDALLANQGASNIHELLEVLENGAAIVLSLDSEEHNNLSLDVLDFPLSDRAYVRDLSLLEGVKAITIVNKFSSLARIIDKELHPHLAERGYVLPKSQTTLNSFPIVAEGLCLVTYDTGFETDCSQMTIEKIAAQYTSMQLAIKRVMELPGYENASYTLGENVGKGSGQSLKENHKQGFVSKYINIRQSVERIHPTQEDVLYENGSVYVIVHPASYSQTVIQFKEDRDFVYRSPIEINDFAEAICLHSLKLREMGYEDWNVYMRGNDFTVRPVPDDEKTSRLGFFERATNTRIVTSQDFVPMELAPSLKGDNNKFIQNYRVIQNNLHK